MTATKVYEVLNSAFPGCVHAGPNGVALVHKNKTVLRLERGSGIAGRGDVWAITFPGHPGVEPITNIDSEAGLKNALRELILSLASLALGVRSLGVA